MSRTSVILPFAKAVLLGSVAGAAPYLLLSLVFVLLGLPKALTSFTEFLAMIGLAVLPIAVALPMVLTGSIAIGLPATAALRHWELESGAAYTAIGTVSGGGLAFAIAVLFDVPDPPWAGFLGSISGAVTGLTWWRSGRAPYVI